MYSNFHYLFGNVLITLYVDTLKKEPKPHNLSKSLYVTCLAIRILEKLGNSFPSQAEIDAIEVMIRRLNYRKSIKAIFNNACLMALSVAA